MIVGICKVELLLFESNSLKEKRMIIKSIIGRIQSRFNASVAEVGYHDLWARSEIGIACVSTDTKHANQMLESIISFIEKDGRVEIISQEIEYSGIFIN
ncbi:MAG: DUF503 domain-containing protein [Clostridiales bacterium]|nr:DUF503 domain-containing protein [Clostridiales bacterium]